MSSDCGKIPQIPTSRVGAVQTRQAEKTLNSDEQYPKAILTERKQLLPALEDTRQARYKLVRLRVKDTFINPPGSKE